MVEADGDRRMTEAASETAKPRKVGLLLGIGIFLLPIIFAWFTLRKGHSVVARVVSLGWLGIVVIATILSPPVPPSGDAPGQSARPAVETKTPEQVAAEDAERLSAAYRRNPETALKLDVSRGTKVGFETILEISGAITNDASFDIKDPQIECLLFGPSGTQVGRVRDTLYEIIPANGSKAFTELSMGFMGSQQVANYTCSIRDASPTT